MKSVFRKMLYFPEKVFRFMERLFVWIPVLWRDEDWDFEYLLEIVRFKLNRMSKNIDKYSYHLHKDRDVKKIKEVLSHIDHYKNIEKYAGDYVTEEETNLPIQDWLNRKLTSKQTYILKRNVELEKWHWQEIWRKISKNGQCWWS